MANYDSTQPHILRSVCALVLVAFMVFGSVFTVAAAATVPETAQETEGVEATQNALYDYLSEGGDFHVLSAYEVSVVNGDDVQKILVSGGTVKEALESADIELGDSQITYPAFDSEITSDVEIRILDAKKIKLTADGKTKKILLPYGIVEESLMLAGVELGKDDILNVERNADIASIDSITIKRVTYKNETVSEKIPYDKVKENSDKIDLGETKLKTKGVNGEKAVVKKVKYIDGKRDSSKTVAEKVIKKPVDEITLVGTKGAANAGGAGTFTDSNGVEVSYKYVLTGSGTAYTAPAGALTATGNRVYEGGVAVNPNLIPYGSKLYIESTDGSFVYGYATAIDTGGALMDGSAIVDCFYFSYNACVNFGRRNVNVYVIG